jgi:hypothetical protein
MFHDETYNPQHIPSVFVGSPHRLDTPSPVDPVGLKRLILLVNFFLVYFAVNFLSLLLKWIAKASQFGQECRSPQGFENGMVIGPAQGVVVGGVVVDIFIVVILIFIIIFCM